MLTSNSATMPSPASPSDEPDFEQALQAVERSLQALKDRYEQVKTDQQRQQDLQQQLSQLQRSSRRSPQLRAELKQIQQQLEELEIALESQLFSWSGLREMFWQAVRFGGIGVIVGWVLKSLTG